jgi:Cupin-like domain
MLCRLNVPMLRHRRKASRRPIRMRPARAREQLVLDDRWRVWLADNLARGVAVQPLLTRLAGHGVPKGLARREVVQLLRDGGVQLCRAALRRARNYELALRLHRTMWRERSHPLRLDRRAGLSPEDFFEHHYCANKPVVLTDVVSSWPAMGRWTLDDFESRFGDVEVEVMAGRDRDPACDSHFEAHRTKLTMRQFVGRIRTTRGTASNDLYMVAQNRTMERGAMRELLQDIVLPEGLLDPARLAGACSLWVGPAGTVTPLHHDQNNILFCQVVGNKRVRLVPPFEVAMFDSLESIYSPIDPTVTVDERHPALADLAVIDLTLEAGEALFIPVGWFHHVTSLSESISMSFTGFRRANNFDWYSPGQLR